MNIISIKPNYTYNQHNNRQAISFKQVSPEHFFIKMEGYAKNNNWGKLMTSLVESSKNQVLESHANANDSILHMGKEYNRIQGLLLGSWGEDFGILKDAKKEERPLKIGEYGKLKEYHEVCKKRLEENYNKFSMVNEGSKKFKSYQAQEQVDNKLVELTQIVGYFDKDKKVDIFYRHPPVETYKILINKIEKILEDLKKSKNKKLTNEDTNTIYEKIGAIHWCIAQSMPFKRGSAAIADAYAKSLFEGLNIQVAPWKEGLSPDMEAFITPLDEYSKKYKTFFEKKQHHNFIEKIINRIKANLSES